MRVECRAVYMSMNAPSIIVLSEHGMNSFQRGVHLPTWLYDHGLLALWPGNVAPDLLVHFGSLSWCALGSVGYPTLYVQEDDVGPDNCNSTPYGSLIVATRNNPL